MPTTRVTCTNCGESTLTDPTVKRDVCDRCGEYIDVRKSLYAVDEELPDEASEIKESAICYQVPPRKYSNAVCLKCEKFIKLNLKSGIAACPSCGENLDANKAASYYDRLSQLEEERIREVAESMTPSQYYVKKFKYQ